MTVIPKSHPRYESLMIRERLVDGFEVGLVAKEGLLAHGRGEAFDYLIGERTCSSARKAIRASAAALLLATHPVISVNGNVAALCPGEMVKLAHTAHAKLEVNLFYGGVGRKMRVAQALEKCGARNILGVDSNSARELSGIDSARRSVDKDGIFCADLVVVPLEDGDRTKALRKAGKKVIAFDLNPLSRTARAASITIVDNVSRAAPELVRQCMEYRNKDASGLRRIIREFDNVKNLNAGVREIETNLSGRATLA